MASTTEGARGGSVGKRKKGKHVRAVRTLPFCDLHLFSMGFRRRGEGARKKKEKGGETGEERRAGRGPPLPIFDRSGKPK